MFAGWKIAGIVGLAGILAVGGMYVLLTNAKAEIAAKDAQLLDVRRVNASLTSQNVTLQAANAEERAARLREKDKARRADEAAAVLVADLQADKDQLTREIEHAFTIDDGPAAPVLVYAANSMRERAQAIAAVRTRHDHQDGGGAVSLAEDALGHLPSAFGTWPTSQREFGVLAMKFADYALEHVKKIAAAEDLAAQENALKVKMAVASPTD